VIVTLGSLSAAHRKQSRKQTNKCCAIDDDIAVFPILADVVKVKKGSGSTAHWSINFIRLSGWLRRCFTLLITPLDIDGIGQNWEDSNNHRRSQPKCSPLLHSRCTRDLKRTLTLPKAQKSRHVCAIPWPSGRWRARRRMDTGHAGRLHSRERARGHVQPRCRGGGNVGREKGCRRRHRSGGGPPASRDAHGRGRHSAAQRTCARRTGRPTRRTGGRVGLIAARWGASNSAARWRQ